MKPPPSPAAAADGAMQVERALHVSDFAIARRMAARAHACAADDPSRALAVFLAARCDFVCGATEDGLRHALDAAALHESLGDHAGHAKARALAARCLLKSGDGGSALEHGLAARGLAARAAPDQASPALQAALLTLGIVYRRFGQLDTARDHCRQAQAALQLLEAWARDNPCELPRVRVNQLETRARLCLALGQAARARALFELALAAGPDADLEFNIVSHLASACEAEGDYRAALGHFRRFHELNVQAAAEAAQRSARIAAVRLDTERQRERAVALERDNARLQQYADALLRQSTEDPLTGLANRRRLDHLLRAGHVGHAALMVDIDHFKAVNDRFSHAVGDAVLCRLAVLLIDGCRSIDTAVRLGGEEFLVLLPQTAALAAAAAAERLRGRIASFDWAALAPGLAVTVSIGAASATEVGSVEGLLALADERLCAAKRGGRNCVVSA